MLISSRGMGLILEMNLGGKTVELLENTCRISPLWVLAVNAGSVALLSTMAGLLLFQKKRHQIKGPFLWSGYFGFHWPVPLWLS